MENEAYGAFVGIDVDSTLPVFTLGLIGGIGIGLIAASVLSTDATRRATESLAFFGAIDDAEKDQRVLSDSLNEKVGR
jgi:hypothetical protein